MCRHEDVARAKLGCHCYGGSLSFGERISSWGVYTRLRFVVAWDFNVVMLGLLGPWGIVDLASGLTPQLREHNALRPCAFERKSKDGH